MQTIINHVSAFWTVVVMNCIQPVNWQYCLPINEWLFPEVMIGMQYYIDKDMNFLYNNERDYLKNLK